MRQRLAFLRRAEELQAVAQPLDHRATHEHAALERVIDPVADFPRDGGQHSLLCEGSASCTEIEQHEAAGAIGILGHAAFQGSLPKRGCVLVARDARDGNCRAEHGLVRMAIDLGRTAYFRQHAARECRGCRASSSSHCRV